MTTAVLDRPAAVPGATDVMRIVQEHLDKEARNRRQSSLQPRDLCPMQKADLVQDLRAALSR